MLKFDDARFVSIQAGAVALAPQLHTTISELIAGGAKNLFFLGAGGAGILMRPAFDLLRARSTFPTFLELPAEVQVADNVNLGADSIVVIPSLSGTTKESVEIIDFVQAKGAKVIALTGYAESPVATKADFNFTNFAADDTSSESFYLQSLIIALAILDVRGEGSDYEQTVAEFALLPKLLVETKEAFEPRASEIAKFIAGHEAYHVITSSGPSWAQAWYYGMCILEEMQWIRTRPVHASDFFHGTLELVEKGVSVILLKGEDETRALTDRVEAFSPEITDALTVIDTADFALAGISDATRRIISPVILATVLERLSAHVELERRHPLTVRRYYRRISY